MTAIAFDLSALFVGAANDAPRGIDRVDLGYARRLFFDSRVDAMGVLPSIAGMGVLTGAEARRFVTAVESLWRETAAPADDSTSAWLRQRLRGEKVETPARGGGRRNPAQIAASLSKLALRARGALFRPAVRVLPRGAIYLNTGQVLLRYGRVFEWLERRPDIKSVFMMHDMIPVLYPEYCGPGLQRHHERSVDTAARCATAMIASSAASAQEIGAALAQRRRADMPIHVSHLPVDDAFFDEPAAPAAFACDAPYFVIVGTIDQRKNHLLLLNVWREMRRRLAAPQPKLVIVGMRSMRPNGVTDYLAKCPALADLVIEVNGLSTPAMRDLMRGARALLTPSFTEGFGLPIVEALALGVPVIASDIPAHREVGGALATYLDPLDGLAWMDEILTRAREDVGQTRARRAAAAAFRPQRWASYFDEVLPFVESL